MDVGAGLGPVLSVRAAGRSVLNVGAPLDISLSIDAARRILETYRVCIVMLTAFSTEEYQQQAREIGTCGYVLKPITSATLLPQLETAYQAFVKSGTEKP